MSTFRGMLAPLNVAACLTWLVLAAGALHEWLAASRAFDRQTALGIAGSLGVLVLLLLRAPLIGRRPQPIERQRPFVVAQLPCALLACWGLPGGLQPILLVIVAAQLAIVYPPRVAVRWLLVANAVLAALFVARYGAVGDVWISLLSIAGFQAFAALSAGYAKAAERARDAALQAQAELRAAQALLDEGTRSDERLRLSRELHDIVGHKLTALKLQLALVERRQPQDDTLRLCRQLADEVLAEIRGVVAMLRRHEGVELQQAIAALAMPFAATGPRIDLDLDPQLRVADIARAQALLRCAQESLTNALRHSGARHVCIVLAGGEDGAVLTVDDDGRGLRGAAPGLGLTGMRERLAAVGGHLDIVDAAAGGVRVRATVPA
ncbi:MAG TPA: sensor histidine kinase [Solimonas sp.]|nr:sensor histidine kinase [Solimonas sp.]